MAFNPMAALNREVLKMSGKGGKGGKGGKDKTFPEGRDSKTGRFLPEKEAKRRPSKTTVERVPKSGYGDTKPKKSK